MAPCVSLAAADHRDGEHILTRTAGQQGVDRLQTFREQAGLGIVLRRVVGDGDLDLVAAETVHRGEDGFNLRDGGDAVFTGDPFHREGDLRFARFGGITHAGERFYRFGQYKVGLTGAVPGHLSKVHAAAVSLGTVLKAVGRRHVFHVLGKRHIRHSFGAVPSGRPLPPFAVPEALGRFFHLAGFKALGRFALPAGLEILGLLFHLAGIKILRRVFHSAASAAAESAHPAGSGAGVALEHAVHIDMVHRVQGQFGSGQGDGLAGLLRLRLPDGVPLLIRDGDVAAAGRVEAKDSSI